MSTTKPSYEERRKELESWSKAYSAKLQERWKEVMGTFENPVGKMNSAIIDDILAAEYPPDSQEKSPDRGEAHGTR